MKRTAHRNPAYLLYAAAFGTLRVERKVYVAFAGALALLLIVAVVTWISLAREERATADVTRSYRVLELLESEFLRVRDAESAQRSYILTGDPSDLAYYRDAMRESGRDSASLAGLVSDSLQQVQLSTTWGLIAQRLALLEHAVAARDTGGIEQGAAVVAEGRGRRLMGELLTEFTRLRDRQAELVQNRSEAAARTSRTAQLTTLGAALTALTMLALALTVIARELRDRQRAEAAAQQLASIVESSSDAIVSVDAHRRITTWNGGAERVFGFSARDVIGRELGSLGEAEAAAALAEGLQRALEGEATAVLETVAPRRDGSIVDLSMAISPILSPDGAVRGVSTIARDISAQREVERLKSEFVSVVSHELRTPLTSIRGALGLLSGGLIPDLPPRALRMLNVATDNTDRLVRLINDILDMEKIDSGRALHESRPIDAAELVRAACDEMRQMAERAGVTLRTNAHSVAITADRDRMLQVLTNLISNAIKFSESGSVVHIDTALRGDMVEFEVRDEGRGIPAASMERIFGRFQQVDASDSRQKGGTGLGLAICRGIVQSHGGSIGVESEPGRGSRFHFTIPAVEGGRQRAPEHEIPGSTSVLVCDDDENALAVAGTALHSRGYTVLYARTGEDAIRMAQDQQPAAILLDLVMPGMDGWETLAALKRDPLTAPIPIVIYTALDMDRADVRTASAAQWVEKGQGPQRLLQALGNVLSGTLKPRRVMVVEDDADLARVLCATFAHHGIEARYASTTQGAIDMMSAFAADLVVLDLALHDGSGSDVAAWLRQDDRFNTLPLLVYTARDVDQAERELLGLGGTEIHTKSRTTPDELARRAAALLDHVTSDSGTA